jgi:bifunctional DNA-binding transcriptional regulator/antitoxin component of YhaV-PrlF toxin-antitoxin module
MAKVTGKYQITLPKALVDQCEIQIGDELELRSAGRSIHIDRVAAVARSRADKLAHFDRATQRQRVRQAARPRARARSRGWVREELYDRGRSR